MVAAIEPADASHEILWSVYTSDDKVHATINKNGLLTGVLAGNVTVIAKVLDDSNLKYDTINITVTE